MIFGTPVSWFLVEIFSIVIFLTAVNHAVKQENAFIRILELFGFILGAAIFENVGTNVVHTYYYDARRILMVGGVPLEILFLEASIWYGAFNLVKKMNVPVWAMPFIVGLFGSVQDMTIDPAAVFDTFALPQALAGVINNTHPGALGNGILSGQWNWTNPGYDGGFFGIPFYNYSGWMYLMFFYTAFVLIGRWLHKKTDITLIGFIYPFVAGILQAFSFSNPISRFALFGNIDPFQSTYNSELIMLIVNFTVAITLIIIFRKRLTPIDMKKDGLILFGFPVILHLYDIVYAFARGTTVAYVPVLVVSAIHFAYLYLLFRQNKKLVDNL
jgi:hypothetical protein